MASELTESEAQRYDRQIRVWGAEAQARIQNSRVLVCGLSNMNVEVRSTECSVTSEQVTLLSIYYFVSVLIGCEEHSSCWHECDASGFESRPVR